MTEKHFSQMLDLWKKCDNQGITRSKMFHMSEIIQASRNPEYVIEVYNNALKRRALPFIKNMPRKISLYSDDCGFRPHTDLDEEIAQRLTITCDGRVYITRYNFDDKIISKEYHKIKSDYAINWMCKLCSHLSVAVADDHFLDVGSWSLKITDSEKKKYHITGDLIDGYDKWLDSYSEEIRNILDIPDLYVFNCDCSRKIILCSCEFEFGGKQYYYKTDDKSIEIGDNVEVPVGEHGRTKIVKVVNIESATEDDLPYEYGEIKSIIGLARPDDSYNSGEKYSLYMIVKKHVDEIDCENLLEFGAPNDEYDYESRTISEMLRSNMDVYQISSIIANVMESSFSHPYDTSFFVKIASKIKAEMQEEQIES